MPFSKLIAPVFTTATRSHISAAAIAPEMRPNIRTILVIISSCDLARNVRDFYSRHISRKYEFSFFERFSDESTSGLYAIPLPGVSLECGDWRRVWRECLRR